MMGGDVVRLGPESERDVVGVFCEAFHDYAVMRFTLGDEGDYEARLGHLVSFFVGVRVLRDEPMLGMYDDRGLVAAATVSRPNAESTKAVAELRERTWSALGQRARERYEIYGRATAPFEVAEPHIHLNMIGALDRGRGKGHGGALLRAVHALSASDPTSAGVTLATETEANVTLYERFGYEVVGTTLVGGSFTSWGFWRPDSPGSNE